MSELLIYKLATVVFCMLFITLIMAIFVAKK